MDIARRRFGATVIAALAAFAGCSAGDAPAPTTSTDPAPAAAAPAAAAAESTEGGMKSEAKRETAILAGGCFWGMEELIRQIPGVLSTEVGYCGGTTLNATYEQVKTGATGHAEAVKVEFDPAKLPFDALLGWFFRMHDPTTLNRQGNDIGDAYRSVILCTSPEQKAIAERVKAEVGKSGKWKNPIVTEIRDAGPWSRAEEYHQDYLQKHPGGYTCHWLRD